MNNIDKVIYTPKEMYNVISQYVIGQENAKKTLCVAIYNHYKRILYNLTSSDVKNDVFSDVNIEKSNIIVIGNTGTGKTYLIKKIANMLRIPCYIADSTRLTQSGYVGDDVETILTGLLQECNYDVQTAQMGIVVLDEFDKLSRKSDSPSITRDVGGEGVQQGLLKIVEGSRVGVPPQGGRKHPEQPLIYLDTTNILFIGLGSFDGLKQIIERRLDTRRIGFIHSENDHNTQTDFFSETISEDLVKFGIIPELTGRFPIITYTNDLTKENLIEILTQSKNSIIKQYQKLMSFDNITLQFKNEAVSKIADYTLMVKTGARGLRQIIEKILNNIIFEQVDGKAKTIIINENDVDNAMNKSDKKAA